MSAPPSPEPRAERSVGPYPYARWPALRRLDQQLLQRSLRGLPADFAPVLAQAQSLLGASVTVAEGAAQLWSAETTRQTLRSPLACLWLELEAGARVETVLCELAPELAGQLVDRVLGGDGAELLPLSEPVDDLSAGVACYLAARLCAAGGSRLRTRALLTDRAQALALLGADRVLCWPLSLRMASRHRGWLRVLIPEQSAPALEAPMPGAPRSAPTWLAALPLRLCAHAARLSLPLRDLRALREGDVVVPGHSSVHLSAGAVTGYAELHAFGARHGTLQCAICERDLVLDANVPVHPEFDMSETTRLDPPPAAPDLTRLPDDAPIELCVELARFTLRLDALSALRPGQVLSSGSAIGEHVTLTAGGTALARGELVDIEGEVGVRILELASP